MSDLRQVVTEQGQADDQYVLALNEALDNHLRTITQDYNTNHEPAGSPKGGQFASRGGVPTAVAGFSREEVSRALAEEHPKGSIFRGTLGFSSAPVLVSNSEFPGTWLALRQGDLKYDNLNTRNFTNSEIDALNTASIRAKQDLESGGIDPEGAPRRTVPPHGPSPAELGRRAAVHEGDIAVERLLHPEQISTTQTQHEMFPNQNLGQGSLNEEAFNKAGIYFEGPEYHRNEGMSEIRQREFLDEWDSRVHMPPAQFKKEFLGGLKASMSISVDQFGVWGIRGGILDEANNKLGEYDRRIDFTNNRAESEWFKLREYDDNGDKIQGHGLGKKMLAGNVDMYQRIGLDAVDVHANIDVGGYAWAKYGYVPKQNDWDNLRSDLSTDVRDEDSDIMNILADKDPKAIWALADSKWGKKLLAKDQIEWHGTLNFSDKESMDRFHAYVGKVRH